MQSRNAPFASLSLTNHLAFTYNRIPSLGLTAVVATPGGGSPVALLGGSVFAPELGSPRAKDTWQR